MRKSFLCFLFTFATINGWAYDFMKNGIFYNIISETKVSVAEGEYSGDIVLPETVSIGSTTYKVTQIDGHAFCNCTGLTSIVISNTITDIGVSNYAWGPFRGCTNLKSVVLGTNVNMIAPRTFRDCSSLEYIKIQSAVKFDNEVFIGCESLKNVDYTNVSYIYNSSFRSYGSNPLEYAHTLKLNGVIVEGITLTVLH